MVSAIRQRVKIGPGGLVEVRSSELHAGSLADVIILVDTTGAPERAPLEALDALQQSLNLNAAAAAQWAQYNRDERRASSERRENQAK